MKKINFEVGTQVSPAKVTIDNVDHEVTPAVWEGNTPLSPFVLNKMQDNIEEETKTTQTTEVLETLTIENCAPVSAKLDIKSGKTIQEGEPSTDNIIPIRNVGDNINKYKMPQTATSNGVTLTLKENGKFDLKGTATGLAIFIIYEDISNAKLIDGETYTLSWQEATNKITTLISAYNNATWIKTHFYLTNGNKIQTIKYTKNSSTTRLRYEIRVESGTNVNISDTYIKLEPGTISTPYTPYNCGSIDFQLSNEDNSQSKIVSFLFTERQVLHKGDYLASNGIHQVKRKVQINSTNFNIAMPYEGICLIMSRTTGLTLNYINLEGLCTHFKNAQNEKIVDNSTANQYLNDNEFSFRNSSTKDRVFFRNSSFKTLTDWVNFFDNNEVLLEYEITEIIVPYTTEQKEAYYQLQHLLMYEGYTKIECIDEIKPDIQATYWYNNELNKSYAKRIDTLEERIRLLEKAISTQ